MPAEIISSAFCADYWSDFVYRGYNVRFYGSDQAPTCECKAYQYAPPDNKTCKHIDYVFKHGCFWNPQWYEGGTCEIRPTRRAVNIIPRQKCQKCKGPMVGVRIAV